MAENETGVPAKLPYPSSTGEVKLGAEDFKELAEKANTFLKEHTLAYKSRTASYEAVSGELGFLNKIGATVTLPSVVTASQLIGIQSTAGGAIKITTSGGAEIIGDYIAATGCELLSNQHLWLFSSGSNWYIVAGEAKRTGLYTENETARVFGTEYEPSSTRPVFVILEIYNNSGSLKSSEIFVGGKQITICQIPNTATANPGFWVNPGQKWYATAGPSTLLSSYLIL